MSGKKPAGVEERSKRDSKPNPNYSPSTNKILGRRDGNSQEPSTPSPKKKSQSRHDLKFSLSFVQGRMLTLEGMLNDMRTETEGLKGRVKDLEEEVSQI
jgi:hypothetical protein